MRPIVSWVMPAFNAEKYIERAIESILSQTIQDYEIIIVLEPDCKDRTEEICTQYAQKDKRFVIVKNKERLGIAKSLNVGLKIASGKYIARMDADDYSYPTRLEKQIDYLEKNSNVGILCTNRRVICDDGNVYTSDHPTDEEAISVRLLFSFCLNHPSMMFRNDLFKDNGWKYPEELEAEDFGLCAELVKYTKIACLGEVLLDYYEHGNNAIYSRFDAVRNASAIISKNAIKSRLLVADINKYDDIYFGWRELDYPKCELEEYLVNGYRLLQEISSANDKLNVFDEKVFNSEINRQWKMTFNISAIGFLVPDLEFKDIKDEYQLREIIRQTENKYYQIFSCKKKVLIWGIGGHARKILEPLNGYYPFRVIGFIDSKKNKESFLNFRVFSPYEIEKLEWDFICIASYWGKEEIYNQLTKKMNIDPEKIFVLPDTSVLKIMAEKFRNVVTADKKQAYLFMSPDYGNLGDHAIAIAEKKMLEDNNYCVHEFPADEFIKYEYLTQFTKRTDDLIAITGGGFLGSLWYDHQKKVEDIIRIHKHNKIIVFPQTMYWDDKEKKEQSVRVFSDAENLTICARDKMTFSAMKNIYPMCNILLAPDMVLYKDWDFSRKGKKREGVLLCLKNDKESVLSEDDKTNIYKISKEVFGAVNYFNTDKGIPISANQRNTELEDVLDKFIRAEIVITDRLHGMIFSAITETPCLVLNNCNHKLKMTYEWVKELPYIRFCDDGTITKEMIEDVLEQPCRYTFDKDNFQEIVRCL